MSRPPFRHIVFTAAMLGLGLLAGLGMARIGTPLPFMLGSLIAGAVAAIGFQRHFPEGYIYPQNMRKLFVGVIGTMIGAQVTPDLVSLLPKMAISVPAVAVFIVAAQAINYQLLRRIGGHDPATAFFAGAPGGLVESIALGEDAGADIRVLTLMQFLRIIVVVSLVPLAMSVWQGHPVGSAAGLTFSRDVAQWADIPLVLAIAVVGVMLGSALKLPAGQLMGPLLLAGVASGTGLIDLTIPGWLVALSQIVLGTGLGLRFTGMTRRMLVTGLGLSLLSVSAMMALGVALAAAVHGLTGMPLDMLVISFAPGGVTEMSLIALSLSANPAFVTLHHLVRISLTVVSLGLSRKLGIVRFERTP